MSRTSKIACLLVAALLLPASAEAKRRYGNRAITEVPPTKTNRSMVVVPVPGASRVKASEADTPNRVPFPPPTTSQTEPAALRLSINDDKKVWCRSDVVVGGFCVLN